MHLRTETYRRCRAGFTLVELLVVMTVIATLASLVLVAMYTAQESAREAKTRGTITKINNVIMPLYEAYRYRRVPVTISNPTPKQRLDALRELMRMEMPDRWTDVTDDPVLIRRPAVSVSYENRLNASPKDNETKWLHEQAETLFLTVSRLGEDGLEFFHASEMADTDEDGLNEFVDGWGRPIRWVRWPAGFRSPLQNGTDPDPFDPRRVYPNSTQTQPTFAVWPLIYSAGQDESFDVLSNLQITGHVTVGPSQRLQYSLVNNNPFIADGDNAQVGMLHDADESGTVDHFDNIHNHDLSRGLQ